MKRGELHRVTVEFVDGRADDVRDGVSAAWALQRVEEAKHLDGAWHVYWTSWNPETGHAVVRLSLYRPAVSNEWVKLVRLGDTVDLPAQRPENGDEI